MNRIKGVTASAKTLRALERAAMRWFNAEHDQTVTTDQCPKCRAKSKFLVACNHHAIALKRKRTGRR